MAFRSIRKQGRGTPRHPHPAGNRSLDRRSPVAPFGLTSASGNAYPR